MNLFRSFFKNSFENHLNINDYRDPQQLLKQLINQIKHSNQHKDEFVKTIIKLSQKSSFHRIKVLSVLNLLIMKSQRYYELTTQVLPFKTPPKQQESNIEQKVISKYQQFILKCCFSSEKYSYTKQRIETRNNKQILYNQLFYYINLLNNMLIDSLESQKVFSKCINQNLNLIKFYLRTLILQITSVFSTLEKIIHRILQTKYFTIANKVLLKNIFLNEIPSLNRMIFTFFRGKNSKNLLIGHKIPSFIIQQQNEQIRNIITDILNSQSEKKLYQNKHKQKNKRQRISVKIVKINNEEINFEEKRSEDLKTKELKILANLPLTKIISVQQNQEELPSFLESWKILQVPEVDQHNDNMITLFKKISQSEQNKQNIII